MINLYVSHPIAIDVVIPGQPTAWAAPYFARNHGVNPRFREKEKAIYELKKQYTGPLIEQAVSIGIFFFMKIPKSASKKMREKMLKDEVKCTKKPDIDNACKFSLDCIKGLIIKDDNQIVKLLSYKRYSENPETCITIVLL